MESTLHACSTGHFQDLMGSKANSPIKERGH